MPSLDGIRAISILMVCCGHLSGTRHFSVSNPGGYGRWFGDVAHLGVFVFFVISGFLITSLLAHRERLEHFELAFPSKVRTNDGIRPRGWLSGDGRFAPSIAGYNLLASSRHTPLRTSLQPCRRQQKSTIFHRCLAEKDSVRWRVLPIFTDGWVKSLKTWPCASCRRCMRGFVEPLDVVEHVGPGMGQGQIATACR
jgi:hypothetical protein